MVNFLLKKIFRGILNEAISLAEIDVTFKVTSISTNEIVLFRLPRKIFLNGKLTFVFSKTFENPGKEEIGLQLLKRFLDRLFSIKE